MIYLEFVVWLVCLKEQYIRVRFATDKS